MMNNNMIRSIQSHSVSVAVLRTSLLRAQLIDGFKRAFRSSIYWKLYSFFLCVVAVCCWCWCRCCCFVFDVQNHIVRITLVKKRIHCHVVKHTVWSFHSVSQSVSQPVSSITSMEMERQKTETIETDFEAHARARLLTHSFGTSTLSLGKCLFTAFLSYAVILGVCLLFIVSYIVKAHINRAFLAQALLFDFVESRMNTHTHKEVYAVTDIVLIR